MEALRRHLEAEMAVQAKAEAEAEAEAEAGSGNSRNGSTPKTVQTEIGPIPLQMPRDRAGTFTPMLVPTGERRLGGLSDVIISLYAG